MKERFNNLFALKIEDWVFDPFSVDVDQCGENVALCFLTVDDL